MRQWRGSRKMCIRDSLDRALVNLKSERIQCDEIWSFVYAKAKNVAEAKAAPEGAGDCWTWTAIDADTKLMVAWSVGDRDAKYANDFMKDVASRLATRVQLTTDGHKPYLEAVEGAFGAAIDYAMLIKHYGEPVGATGRYLSLIHIFDHGRGGEPGRRPRGG